jgi:hypothetical protein
VIDDIANLGIQVAAGVPSYTTLYDFTEYSLPCSYYLCVSEHAWIHFFTYDVDLTLSPPLPPKVNVEEEGGSTRLLTTLTKGGEGGGEKIRPNPMYLTLLEKQGQNVDLGLGKKIAQVRLRKSQIVLQVRSFSTSHVGLTDVLRTKHDLTLPF